MGRRKRQKPRSSGAASSTGSGDTPATAPDLLASPELASNAFAILALPGPLLLPPSKASSKRRKRSSRGRGPVKEAPDAPLASEAARVSPPTSPEESPAQQPPQQEEEDQEDQDQEQQAADQSSPAGQDSSPSFAPEDDDPSSSPSAQDLLQHQCPLLSKADPLWEVERMTHITPPKFSFTETQWELTIRVDLGKRQVGWADPQFQVFDCLVLFKSPAPKKALVIDLFQPVFVQPKCAAIDGHFACLVLRKVEPGFWGKCLQLRKDFGTKVTRAERKRFEARLRRRRAYSMDRFMSADRGDVSPEELFACLEAAEEEDALAAAAALPASPALGAAASPNSRAGRLTDSPEDTDDDDCSRSSSSSSSGNSFQDDSDGGSFADESDDPVGRRIRSASSSSSRKAPLTSPALTPALAKRHWLSSPRVDTLLPPLGVHGLAPLGGAASGSWSSSRSSSNSSTAGSSSSRPASRAGLGSARGRIRAHSMEFEPKSVSWADDHNQKLWERFTYDSEAENGRTGDDNPPASSDKRGRAKRKSGGKRAQEPREEAQVGRKRKKRGRRNTR